MGRVIDSGILEVRGGRERSATTRREEKDRKDQENIVAEIEHEPQSPEGEWNNRIISGITPRHHSAT
jgi:hypothetical protein